MNRLAQTLWVGFVSVGLISACGESWITGDPGGSGTVEYDAGEPPTEWDAAAATCGCPTCEVTTLGIDGIAFDITEDPSEFVGTDSTGALVVDKSNAKYNKYLWVADTNLPGVVKIDLDTFAIVGRYITGGSSTSRTTVNVLGEAFVGSRSNGNGLAGVTKVLPYGPNCPDSNGDGVITTSTGPGDVLAWGQDDCVAWHTEAGGDIRGLAAQDIAGVDPGDACEGDDIPVEIPEQHYVWIGGLHNRVYKIDAATGEILLNLTAPAPVYGMALDGEGKLWIGTGLAFLDTNQCIDQAACEAEPVCTQSCSTTVCPDTCDGAVKAAYSGISGYGITVDCENRVWMSSSPTKRYDPNAPVDQRLAHGPGAGSGGIAADANGWVWAATNGASTIRIDADTLEGVSIAAPAKGVAVDSMGRILSVYNTGVHLIEPGPTLDAYDLTSSVTSLVDFAYAYSDMTGVQTRLASDGPGWYRHVFAGCDTGDTTYWRTLEWALESPPGTYASFYARSAATVEELDDAEWRPIATCLDDGGCYDGVAITDHDGAFLELEVRLTAVEEEVGEGPKGCSFVEGESVRLEQVKISHDCTAPLG